MTNQSQYHPAIFFISIVFGFPEKELTSLETLSVLRNLPKTDPDFYRELTEAAEVVSGVSESSEEPTYSNNFEDDSAVPMDVVLQCMAGNGLRDGFGVDDHGSITRVGSAESMEIWLPDHADKLESWRPTEDLNYGIWIKL
ncbi:hypothetical protein H0H92_007890 [Tricholoma furcatifolium]|nr:hypothetical protein H0H92_007890 [Tricholoma furcatifolium]